MMQLRKCAFITVALAFLVLTGAYGAVPNGYYDGIEGQTGGELRNALHAIIKQDGRNGAMQHAVIPYGSLMPPLRDIWRDPTNSANVVLMYTASSVDAFSGWNREHLWPRARGNSEQAGPDDSDLFHVVPSDAGVNSLRGNLYFDFSDVNDPKYGIGGGGTAQFTYDSDSWQPPPAQRGDIARAMFYMDVRYNGSELSTSDLELVSVIPSGPQMAKLNTLLLWHAEDPPDDAERARNDLIYFNYQGNRNPFIDRPELVAAIWGSGTPDDPLSAPVARVSALSSTATETPPSPGRFLVSLNQFAGTNGVTVSFSMSGTAARSEYSLASEGLGSVSYDPATGSGSVLIPPGYATATIILTPQADSVPEDAETAHLNIVVGSGYQFTPDASASAIITIRDMPSFPVSWNFDAAATTNKTLAANVGQGFVSFSNWGGTFTNFTGRTSNSLGLVAGTGGNGSSIDFNFSMTGFRSLSLGFYTRGTSSGFTNGLWSASIDGVNFTTNVSTNTASTSTSFASRFVDFSIFSWLNNALNVIIRYTLSGASSISGNNRLDDLVFSAIPLATGASPSNDYFIEASLLEGAEATATGSNVGASRESGEPLHNGTGSASVWWRWTAPENGIVTIATTGSGFDTVLAVYTGSSVGALTPLASDDDSGGGNTSRITFTASAGTTYRVAVDGFGSATGDIALRLERSVAPMVSSFTPSAAMPGAEVTINGFNLDGASGVQFGGVSASSFRLVSSSQIVATVPDGALSGVIGVVSPNGTSQSATRFGVTRRPSVPFAAPDRQSISGLASSRGSASTAVALSVTADNLPDALRVAAPAGFEVSHDGENFAAAVEILAPDRLDHSGNYQNGWTNGVGGGSGFRPWSLWISPGTGSAGALVTDPADSGVTTFGDRAFCLFASPAASSAWSYAYRQFDAPLAVGDKFSFRWAVNLPPNSLSSGNYFYVGSGGASLVTVWQGTNSGVIHFRASGGSTIDAGIPSGTGPMTWTFTLLDAGTMRVTATGRDGSSEVRFLRDVAISGAPDYFSCYAWQLDADIRRRLYFDDLRIDSASPGGGRLPGQTVYVRLAANAPAGSPSGQIVLSSASQPLGSVNVSGTVTGTNSTYDEWAQSHGLDPQGNGARGADADGDGHNNLREFLFGSPPAQVTGSLWRHEMQPSGLVLTFVGRDAGAAYKVMSTANLAGGAWTEELLAITEAQDQSGVPQGQRRRQVIVPNPSGSRFFRLQAIEIQ